MYFAGIAGLETEVQAQFFGIYLDDFKPSFSHDRHNARVFENVRPAYCELPGLLPNRAYTF